MKNVADGRTDGRADRTVLRAAWSQLKTLSNFHSMLQYVHCSTEYNGAFVVQILMKINTHSSVWRRRQCDVIRGAFRKRDGIRVQTELRHHTLL